MQASVTGQTKGICIQDVLIWSIFFKVLRKIGKKCNSLRVINIHRNIVIF